MDPHPLWLDGLENVLRRIHVQTAAKTQSLDAGAMAVSEIWPDVVIAETTIDGDIDAGLEWVTTTSETCPGTKVVVFSGASDSDHVEATLAAGAGAYIFKRARVDDVVSAVNQMFSRSVFLRSEARPRQSLRAPLAADVLPLTARELDILRLAAEGHSNVRIARILWITEQTVKFHLSNVYRKLNVGNRTEASRWAELHGLLGSQVA